MMRSGPLAVLVAALTSVSAIPALACSPIGYARSGSPRALERNEARALLEKASRVDLVIADTSRPLNEELSRANAPQT